ncbi:MAG: hypothetical protein NTW59_04185 [Candidatus Diapherotrites archaeon]|nr:hypothetical protein [Candidatus Diapherotrites archaeon]
MNKRIALALAALAVLFFAGSALAISGQDAVNFAKKENNFLYDGETSEIFPNTNISFGNSDYWVIAVLNGSNLATFVPVKDDKQPALAAGALARRELIKTAYVLRYEQSLHDSGAQQGLWLFDATNVKFFSDLGGDLKNERVDLTTIGASLGEYPLLQDETDALKAQLEDLYPLAEEISKELLDTIAFESDFVGSPDTNKLNSFHEKFDGCFDLMDDLEDGRKDYSADLDKLSQAIALTSLPIETKQSLNRLAAVPTSFQQFGSKATIATDLRQKIGKVFADASANVDAMVEDLVTREKRNTAYQALYGSSDELLGKTGQNSLNALISLLQSEDNIYRWSEQGKLADAQENWAKAVSFYSTGKYQFVQQYADKARTAGLAVYEAGIPEEPSPINTDLLFTGIAALIAVVIIIYAVRNREKLKGLIERGGGEGEVRVYDFEK